MRQFDDGASLDDLAWSFSASTEFTARYGAALDDAAFLGIVYSNVLGRNPDQAGFDYWLGQMRSGLDQHEVVRWVTANDEFINRLPFTGTAPPLSGALAVASEHGTGWTTEAADVAVDGQLCNQLQRLPVGGVTRSIRGDRNFVAHRIDHGLYAFATNAAASDFVADRQAAALRCDAVVSGSGSSNRVRPASIGAVGDERTGYVVTLVLFGVESANGPGVIMVRRGNVVSITIDGFATGYDRGLHEEVQLASVAKLDALAG